MFDKRTVGTYLALAALVMLGSLVALMLARKPDASAFIAGAVTALILPVPLIWLIRRMGLPIGQAVNCERCGAAQPLVRRPANTRQAMLGGHTCAKCGAELDARGRLRAP